MTRFGALLLTLVAFCAGAAQAMPAASLRALPTGMAIPVGGCGLGVPHGPFDNCPQVEVIYNGYGDNYHAYRQGYVRGYRRGYDRGYYRGYNDAYYDAYPYVRYYDYRGVVAIDRGRCGFGSYLSCDHGTCWRYCY